jgi:hypothetical protein
MFESNVLNLDRITETRRREEYHAAFGEAKPFKHIVFENLFSDVLLDEILKEFDQRRPVDLLKHNNGLEKKIGTRPNALLGPASQAYFNAIHSGLFVAFLTEITGIKGLLPDPQLLNGGLHEVPHGGAFVAHVDFKKHSVTQLDNRLVLLTYVNRGWEDSYGGELELYDGETKKCVKTITPVFGRSVLLYHSPLSWHGHSVPVNAPDRRSRKSLAAYYYSNGRDDVAASDYLRIEEDGSVPMWPTPVSMSEKVKIGLKQLTPPIFMNWAKDLRDVRRRKELFKA